MLEAAEKSLKAGEVHVWRADLHVSDVRLAELRETLSVDEIARAERFHFEKHKKRFIAGRGLLREILGAYLNRKPDQIAFAEDKHGKPMLKESPGTESLYFNLSHSDDAALYAVSRDYAVGVDIELNRPLRDQEQLAKRVLHSNEWGRWQALPETQQTAALYRSWTQKEAVIKLTGEGMSREMHSIDLSAGAHAAVVPWVVHELDVEPGVSAALAVAGSGCRVRYGLKSF